LLSRFEFCFESLKIRSTGPGASIWWKLGQKSFLFSPHPCDLNLAIGNDQWQLSIAAVATTNWRQTVWNIRFPALNGGIFRKTISFRAGGRKQVEFHGFTTWGFMRSDSKEDKGYSHCRQEGSASHYDKNN